MFVRVLVYVAYVWECECKYVCVNVCVKGE